MPIFFLSHSIKHYNSSVHVAPKWFGIPLLKKTKIMLQLIRWKVKLKSLHQNVQSIHRKTREAVGFEPTIFDIHILSPIHWATNQTIKIIIINADQKSIFFHLYAKNHENTHFLPRDGKKLAFNHTFNWWIQQFGLWPSRFDSGLLYRRSQVQISVPIFILSVKKLWLFPFILHFLKHLYLI